MGFQMRLGDYVKSLPFYSRGQFRLDLAERHGCSVSLVRKWENYPPPTGWDKNKSSVMSRKHPADLASMKITEEMTEGAVTRFDLRPEIWSLA
jgi:uncharacterized protein YjcR